MVFNKDDFESSVSFWNKGTVIDLLHEYELYESEHDILNISYMLSFDELCEYAVFLFCGDWSRNINILPEEEQNDLRVQKLFEYVDIHCKKEY